MAPNDVAIQVRVPRALWSRLLYLPHSSVIARHPEQRRMYDSMQREFYWPQMVDNLYTVVSNCSACERNRVEPQLKRQLQLCSASGSIECFAMDIL